MYATAQYHRNKRAEGEDAGMAKHHTVRVPAAHAAGVVQALVAIYACKVDDLAEAARAYQADREPLATVVAARREVIEAEGKLEALGWQLRPGGSDVELEGPASGVREILYVALVAAADAASAACRDYERARIDRAALAAAVAELATLHQLFDALEDADTPEPA
jgi:hypothetical protein